MTFNYLQVIPTNLSAYVKTVNSRIYVTLRINSGGVDVATSGNTSANGTWEELSCSYTPAADEMASIQLVKTQGQLVNIDKIKVICTSCLTTIMYLILMILKKDL